MSEHNDKTTTALQVERLHPLVGGAMAKMAGPPDPAMLRELLAIQREWEAGEARKAYTAAIVQLKRDLPMVLAHDQEVDFETRRGDKVYYRHTSLAAVVDAVTEPMQKNGFSVSWIPSTDENGKVTVTCRLTHSEGHSEEGRLTSVPDTSGMKNPTQAILSTVTMLKRYTLLALLGIATADHFEDHKPPGKDNGKPEPVDSKRNLKAVASLRQVGISLEEAEEAAGAPVAEWTSTHLAALRELHHKAKEAAEGQKETATADQVETLFDQVEQLDLTTEEHDLLSEASFAFSDQDYETTSAKLTAIIEAHKD